MILNEQCDFADGICNCQGLSKVLLMNWEMQPQVFRKGTIVGHMEQAKIVGHDDRIWGDNWEELLTVLKVWLEYVIARTV